MSACPLCGGEDLHGHHGTERPGDCSYWTTMNSWSYTKHELFGALRTLAAALRAHDALVEALVARHEATGFCPLCAAGPPPHHNEGCALLAALRAGSGELPGYGKLIDAMEKARPLDNRRTGTLSERGKPDSEALGSGLGLAPSVEPRPRESDSPPVSASE